MPRKRPPKAPTSEDPERKQDGPAKEGRRQPERNEHSYLNEFPAPLPEAPRLNKLRWISFISAVLKDNFETAFKNYREAGKWPVPQRDSILWNGVIEEYRSLMELVFPLADCAKSLGAFLDLGDASGPVESYHQAETDPAAAVRLWDRLHQWASRELGKTAQDAPRAEDPWGLLRLADDVEAFCREVVLYHPLPPKTEAQFRKVQQAIDLRYRFKDIGLRLKAKNHIVGNDLERYGEEFYAVWECAERVWAKAPAGRDSNWWVNTTEIRRLVCTGIERDLRTLAEELNRRGDKDAEEAAEARTARADFIKQQIDLVQSTNAAFRSENAVRDALRKTPAAATNTAGRKLRRKEPEHSADFTSVLWYGTRYQFTKRQAECVGLLWAEWEKGGLTLSEKTIADRIGSSADDFRLSHVFREFKVKTNKKGRKKRTSKAHEAWGRMIVSAGKGIFGLAEPKKM